MHPVLTYTLVKACLEGNNSFFLMKERTKLQATCTAGLYHYTIQHLL